MRKTLRRLKTSVVRMKKRKSSPEMICLNYLQDRMKRS